MYFAVANQFVAVNPDTPLNQARFNLQFPAFIAAGPPALSYDGTTCLFSSLSNKTGAVSSLYAIDSSTSRKLWGLSGLSTPTSFATSGAEDVVVFGVGAVLWVTNSAGSGFTVTYSAPVLQVESIHDLAADARCTDRLSTVASVMGGASSGLSQAAALPKLCRWLAGVVLLSQVAIWDHAGRAEVAIAVTNSAVSALNITAKTPMWTVNIPAGTAPGAVMVQPTTGLVTLGGMALSLAGKLLWSKSASDFGVGLAVSRSVLGGVLFERTPSGDVARVAVDYGLIDNYIVIDGLRTACAAALGVDGTLYIVRAT